MYENRIEIKRSKKKSILIFLGAVAFVIGSFFMITTAESHDRYDPVFIKVVGVIGIVFFGLGALYIFYKLFDTKPALIIDNDGIFNNTSATSDGHMIPWREIKGIRIVKVRSTKFILVDIEKPEVFIKNFGGITNKLMSANNRMYGTPVSIACSFLERNTNDVFKIIADRLTTQGTHESRQEV
jgi:hypothetical protein